MKSMFTPVEKSWTGIGGRTQVNFNQPVKKKLLVLPYGSTNRKLDPEHNHHPDGNTKQVP
jgi:hypothetical protein